MIRFTFVVDGEVQVDRAIEQFAKGVEDYTPAWKNVRDIFWQAEKERFEAAHWEALSPVYAAWKAVHYAGKPILQRTGALMESLTGHHSGSIVEIHPLSVEVGSSLPYGIYHQRGTGSMPQRKIIDLDEGNKKAIMKAIQRHLVNAARGA